VGQITGGTVTNLMPFGAFVKLEDGIEGLVHVSELSQRRVNNPKECVYQGQNIQVLILSIDTQTRRIGLSYKQAFGLQ
jgi:small subunit ribosomal protein S1